MSEADWIDARTACAVLGVRAQSLYAYASRKLLRTCSDAGDPRRSLYLRQDVEQLAARHRRPRARAEVAAQAIRWGDPVLDTAVSGVRNGQLWFGDRLATDCAETMSLESVAAHHWRVDAVEPVAGGQRPSPTPGDTSSSMSRALRYLANQAMTAAPMQDRDRLAIGAEGAALLAGVAGAVLQDAAPGPIHRRIAKAWDLRDDGEDIARQTLVLLSDHELNPSTFAVRVCASTAASLPAALLAGLATLSGPRHGGVAILARDALDAGAEGDAALADFLRGHADLSPYAFGYGHPLYPAGDPRAAHLLAALGEISPAVAVVRAIERRLDQRANIDAALAAVAVTYGLPADAGFALFAVGRVAGWIAHALEQVGTGHIIRPRARFRPGLEAARNSPAHQARAWWAGL
ncbi:MAG: citrate synthase, partial [Brevundimonas sp.]